MAVVQANVSFEHGGIHIEQGQMVEDDHYLYGMFPDRFTTISLAVIPGSPTTFTQTYATTAATVPNATYAAPAVTAATVATANAADQTAIYVEADVDSIATLANALKTEVNKLITDNAAQNSSLAALAADVVELKKLINSLIDGQQAAGIAL